MRGRYVQRVGNETCDIIILDLMLPGMDGLKALSLLKSDSKTKDIPVIIASAKGDENIKVRGLDAGADDYIAKPFGMLELIARVKANLRKTGVKKADEETLECSVVKINNAEHAVYVEGQAVALTLKEYNLLALLMKNADCVVKETPYFRKYGITISWEKRVLWICTSNRLEAN